MTLAGLLAAMKVVGSKLSHQRIVMFGAGSAARGISDQIVTAMMREGLTESGALSAMWLIDSKGLMREDHTGLNPFQMKYARTDEIVRGWQLADPDRITLEDVIKNVRPTALIGTAAQPGAFTKQAVREMARHVARPIIFPLSNPTSKAEATPQDLIHWTEGRALVATGSPFPDTVYNGQVIRIGQCNNAFIFPGVGLGVIAAKATRVTNHMFVAAARALSEFSPALANPGESLFPRLENVREVSRRVAVAVGEEARRVGLAEETTGEELERRVRATMWMPRYAPYKRRV